MAARVLFGVCACLAACSFRHGGAVSGDGGGGGGPDASNIHPDGADAPAECATWHPHHFDACAIPAPSDGIDLDGAWTFSTDTGMFVGSGPTAITPAGGNLVQLDGPTAYLISIESLKIETTGSLRVIGAEPLIVASWDTIEVDGKVDAGSTSAGMAGAGADPPACEAAAQGQTGVSTGGSGGGGGGGFQGNGGHGGTGDMPPGPLGGAGGTALAAPSVVLGGCAGAPSGEAGSDPSASDPTAAAVAGLGGGALQLTARTAITITGLVLTGGAGGGGAPLNSACGGGGGGAGGFVGFDGPSITFTGATIAANGGGGGGSAPFGLGGVNAGQPGQDGQPGMGAAMGGAASSCSEAGMKGGAGPMHDGASSANPIEACGGAGGGGGVGYILTWGTVATSGGSMISPAAQPGP
ncbi:MAG TPA: hypothetical protein VGF94_12955 [Kofleriaceae bacterium]